MTTNMWKLSDGTNLTDWCKENNINYGSVYNHISGGMPVDEACRLALKHKGTRYTGAKYFVGDKTLGQYCKDNNLSYQSVLGKFYTGRTNIKITVDNSFSKSYYSK